MNITITAAAEKFMRRMVRFGGAGTNAGFRLSVSPGGCSGYASEFSVEAAPQPGDAAVEVNGLKVFLPVESRLMLEGATIDFTDTPRESGLTFVNPNAAGCGTCGSSSTSAAPVKVDISGLQRRA
ncbi:MAG: iron-sulfur cluster assembly accessory protein [Proteobacteria bacterium]|nr:iron-sulfur cluster assembly accessory protein [Pseudomonadota bacterium]